MSTVHELEASNLEAIARHAQHAEHPAVIRGLVSDWPSVQLARQSDMELAKHLLSFYQQQEVEAWKAPPSAKGRYFYDDALEGFNFERFKVRLDQVLGELLQGDEVKNGVSIYMGSTPLNRFLPGFSSYNKIPFLDPAIVPNIWVGNQSRVGAHFDLSDNLACVVAGTRVFTLFPPDQIQNLYFGPLHFTPAGQPSSLVNLDDVDRDAFPLFEQAEAHAVTVELQPGDAIFIPSTWIHSVASTGHFNVLVNYWWDNAIAGTSSPFDAMIHGIMSIASLPEHKRRYWKSFFEHFVFQEHGDPARHLPESKRGPLMPMTPALAEHMKQYLATRLK